MVTLLGAEVTAPGLGQVVRHCRRVRTVRDVPSSALPHGAVGRTQRQHRVRMWLCESGAPVDELTVARQLEPGTHVMLLD